jgi:hypothetical protein
MIGKLKSISCSTFSCSGMLELWEKFLYAKRAKNSRNSTKGTS